VADSWWTSKEIQRDYYAFSAVASKEWHRMAKDPEAAKVSGVVSLTGRRGQSPTYYAVNAAGESN